MRRKIDLEEFAWLFRQYRPVYKYVLAVCILNMILAAIGASLALITKGLIDAAVSKTHDGLFQIGLLLLLVILFQLGLRTVAGYLSARAANKLEMNLKNRLFRSVLHKQWLLVSRYHSGDLVSRLNNDVRVITDSAMSFLPGLAAMVSGFAAAFFILLKLDYVFALIILFVGPVFMILGRFYGRIMKKMHTACQVSSSAIREFIQESLQNLVVIKSFAGESRQGERLNDLQETNFRLQMKRSLFGLVAGGGMYLCFWGGYFFAIVWGAYRLSTGFISVGTLAAFVQLSSQVQGPFMSIGRLISSFYASLASAGRIREIGGLPEEQADSGQGIVGFQEIIVQNISYAYDKEPVLDNVSFTVGRGEFVAIIGESGAGKTTLLRLLLGLITPDQGKIELIDEKFQVQNLVGHRRGLFAYVPQGNIVFSGTIRENLHCAGQDLTEEMMIEAVKMACLWDFIKELPDGLETRIGERGLGLSEGQAQRLAIARAILYRTPVLMLDEATSALDAQTELAVFKNIRALSHLQACLVVTHRQAALDFCNQVIQVGDGS